MNVSKFISALYWWRVDPAVKLWATVNEQRLAQQPTLIEP